MNKQEFLAAVRKEIGTLSSEDIRRSLDFCAEIIDDRMDDGMTEAEAVAAFGSVQDAARQILEDAPVPKKPKKRGVPALMWATVIIWGPVWISLLISLWGIVVSLYASAAAVAVSALGSFLVTVAALAQPLNGFFTVGTGFLLAGISILLFLLSGYAAKGTVWVGKKLYGLILCGFGKEKFV